MTSFQDLGLSESILKAIDDMGYTTPTLIQEKAIPFVFMNRDIIASAQTGTGKTASFTLPMMDILDGGYTKPRMPRAIILEPTRELASQVGDNFKAYGKYMKLSYSLIIGGTSMSQQEKEIERGADVLIATPGRLLDLVGRGKVMLNEAKMLVIDEADRMMDMGFIPDIEKLVSIMPKNRQTIMFSATFPDTIKKLAATFLDNPKEIIVAPHASTAENITQYTMHVSPKAKYDTLCTLIKVQEVTTAIIFCNRKRDVDSLFKQLLKEKYSVGALHGDMEQSKRLGWLGKFCDGTINILVCSDVAARGLDIANVGHVFNMEVPIHSEDYVHRIGRTGRAGKLGTAFTFVSNTDKKLWQGVLNIIKKDVEEFSFNKDDKPVSKDTVDDKTSDTPNVTDEKSNKPEKKPRDKPNDKVVETEGDFKSKTPKAKNKPKHANQKTDDTQNNKDADSSNKNKKPQKNVRANKNNTLNQKNINDKKAVQNNPNNKPQHNNRKRYDSQEGIGEVSQEQSDLPFGEQDGLPTFLK